MKKEEHNESNMIEAIAKVGDLLEYLTIDEQER